MIEMAIGNEVTKYSKVIFQNEPPLISKTFLNLWPFLVTLTVMNANKESMLRMHSNVNIYIN